MADYIANAASNGRPSVTVTGAGQMTVNSGSYTVTTALALNDTVSLCKLPAGHKIVDFILDCGELDSGADAIVIDAGIIGGDTDCLFAASTVGQAGGLQRMDEVAGRVLAVSDSDRIVGITVTTGPGTGATDVAINATLVSRAANADD